MSTTKIEFAVQMTCEGCEKSVRKSLENVQGIKSVEIDRNTNTVVVNSSLPTDEVQKIIASTGKKVVIKGAGRKAGVAILEFGSQSVQGVVRFVQDEPNTCIIDGTIDGLKPGIKHILSIHECGDTSQGCESVGDYFKPEMKTPNNRIYGKLGEVKVDTTGRSKFRIEDNVLNLPDVIGRALVVSEEAEDDKDDKKPNRIACGIIARSAGLFQNPKVICACDGVSLWDEQKPPKQEPVNSCAI